jgi:hypothetical protein
MAGGLNNAFKAPSFVWQIWQLLMPVAMVDVDGKKKTRSKTEQRTKSAFIMLHADRTVDMRTLFAVNE